MTDSIENPKDLYKRIKDVMEVKSLSTRGAFLRDVELTADQLLEVSQEAEFASAQVFAEVTLQTTKAALVASYYALKMSNDTEAKTAEAGATALQLIESAFDHYGFHPSLPEIKDGE